MWRRQRWQDRCARSSESSPAGSGSSASRCHAGGDSSRRCAEGTMTTTGMLLGVAMTDFASQHRMERAPARLGVRVVRAWLAAMMAWLLPLAACADDLAAIVRDFD